MKNFLKPYFTCRVRAEQRWKGQTVVPGSGGRAAEASSSTGTWRAVRGGSRSTARLLALCWGVPRTKGVHSLACKERASEPSEQVRSLCCTKVKSENTRDPKWTKTQRNGKSPPGCARAGLFREKTENMIKVDHISSPVEKRNYMFRFTLS